MHASETHTEERPQKAWTYLAPEVPGRSWTIEIHGPHIAVCETEPEGDGRESHYQLVDAEAAASRCRQWRQAREIEGWRLVAGESGAGAGLAAAEDIEFAASEDELPVFDPDEAEAPVTPGAIPAHPRAAEFFGAISAGDVSAVRRMLDEGVPTDAMDGAGTLPVYAAATAGRSEVLRCLIEEAAAEVDVVHPVQGITPLLAAVSYGHREAVEVLLDCGADPEFRSAQGESALGEAARSNDEALRSLLLAAGGKV